MRSQPTVVKDFKKIESFETMEEVATAYNDLVTELNWILKNISFTNMNCEIQTVTLTATGSTRINHSLKVIPKYITILRKDGVGVVYDVPTEWNQKYITLTNSGAEQTITLAIFRE
jgi:archaellum component FlaF (FlaF/FlaG flagellin family)